MHLNIYQDCLLPRQMCQCQWHKHVQPWDSIAVHDRWSIYLVVDRPHIMDYLMPESQEEHRKMSKETLVIDLSKICYLRDTRGSERVTPFDLFNFGIF